MRLVKQYGYSRNLQYVEPLCGFAGPNLESNRPGSIEPSYLLVAIVAVMSTSDSGAFRFHIWM